MSWKMTQAGVERRPYSLRNACCTWCGQKKRTMFCYRAEGGRFLSGLSGEEKPFCGLPCFRAYQ